MKSIVTLSLWWLGSIPFTSAAYDPSSSDNVAVYWGQNSAGGAKTQRSLIEVCRNEKHIDIILLAFLISATDIDKSLNFASSDRPTEKEIIECQTKHNKTLLLSLGGAATDTTWSFASPDQATDAAKRIWAAFGPASPPQQSGPSTTRPFGSACVDGFDLDFEAPYANIHVFARQLRKLVDRANAATTTTTTTTTKTRTRKLYLSAAPQCPFPDANLGPVLLGDAATALDFVFVQFYNNAPCDLRTRDGFRAALADWDAGWARTRTGTSKGRIFVGIPGAATAVGAANGGSYVDGAAFASGYLGTARTLPSFAGVMVWDMSQLDNNTAFLPPIVGALGNGGGSGGSGSGGSGGSGGSVLVAASAVAGDAMSSDVVPTRSVYSAWFRAYRDIRRRME